MQPNEERSPGGKNIVIYKEKTSQEQIQRVYYKVQTIDKPQEKGQIKLTKKKANPLPKQHSLTDVTKINLYQNDGKKKVWQRLGTAYDPKHTTSLEKHGRGSVMALVCMVSNGTSVY